MFLFSPPSGPSLESKNQSIEVDLVPQVNT